MDFLEIGFGYVLRGCYWLVDNYVVSLLLFALVFQILLLPFGIKQQKNMVKQAMLRPQEMAIRKKYAGRNDQVTMRKLQNELLELQQRNGYSPLAGCLPMILQMVIIFPLYWVVIRPLQHAGGLSYTSCYNLYAYYKGTAPTSTTFQIDVASELSRDLADGRLDGGLAGKELLPETIADVNSMLEFTGGSIPEAQIFGIDMAATPFDALGSNLWILIFIPVLNLGLTYLSQFISKKLSYRGVQQEISNGGSMRIMMIVLPLVTFFVTANFAAAIGLYWIFRTILSMLQQFILAKAMPYPTFTEEDYKQAEKEFKKGITTPAANRQYPQREYRSLHHIDDDE